MQSKRKYSSQCIKGERAPRCPIGFMGHQGIPGDILNYSDFYAIMPPDNSSTVAPGTDIDFPQDGPSSSNLILRESSNTFSLTEPGTYLIMFQVSVIEADQLVIALNNIELTYTISGRATGTSQISQVCIITTTTSPSLLSIRNPASESTALTITPLARGTEPVSAHLVILKLS